MYIFIFDATVAIDLAKLLIICGFYYQKLHVHLHLLFFFCCWAFSNGYRSSIEEGDALGGIKAEEPASEAHL